MGSAPTRTWPNRWNLAALLAGAAVLAAMAAAGRLQPWITHDTAGYLEIRPYPASLAGPRLPLYGWLVDAATLGTGRLEVVPWVQVAAYLAAAYGFLRALHGHGLSAAAILACALALFPANVLIILGPALHPELPAVTALLAALACVIRLATGGPRPAALAAGGVATGLAYLLRPSLLPFIVIMPLLLLALGRGRRRLAAAGWLLVAAATPFLAVATLRLAAVGDFGMVSVGGFQLSGMAATMLTPAIADRLPPPLAADARALMAARDAVIAAGDATPVPRNSFGERSFISAALGYFDVFARSFDPILFGAVEPMRRPGESWIQFDRRLMRLSLATIAAAPADYAAWIVGAAARSIGHATVLNLPFALGTLALAAAFVLRRRPGDAAAGRPTDIDTLAWLTGAWWLGAIALPVLVSFAAQRYIDSAALLLAVWPFYGLIRIVCRARGDQPARA